MIFMDQTSSLMSIGGNQASMEGATEGVMHTLSDLDHEESCTWMNLAGL